MKRRNGFVSNSSSTSFIIAINSDTNKCKHCGRESIDIVKLIEKHSSYDTEITNVGYKDVLEDIKEYSDWLGMEEFNDLLSKIKQAHRKNKKIIQLNVSYHDELLINIVYKSENIDVLYESG